jgi:hypothetical protein
MKKAPFEAGCYCLDLVRQLSGNTLCGHPTSSALSVHTWMRKTLALIMLGLLPGIE